MHSNGYTAAPERKRRSMSRVLAASAALLAVAVLLLVLSIVQSRTAAVRNRDGFQLRNGTSAAYAAAGNGLAAVTTTGAQLFTANGKCAASLDFASDAPMCAGS